MKKPFNKILKKISVATLYLGTAALPALIFAGTLSIPIAGYYLQKKGDAIIDKAKQEVVQSSIVAEYRENDLAVLEKQYEEGLLTIPEYTDKSEYFYSEDYLNDIIDTPELKEQKAILKQANEEAFSKQAWGFALVVGGSVISTLSALLLCGTAYTKVDNEVWADTVLKECKEEFEKIDKEYDDPDTLKIDI